MSVRITRKKVVLAGVLVAAGVLSACSSAADVASSNISAESEAFRIPRRIVVVNAITDKFLMTVEGMCSMEYLDGPRRTEMTCKLSDGTLVKHVVQASDNVMVMVEQTSGTEVSTTQYKVFYNPTTVLPNVEKVK